MRDQQSSCAFVLGEILFTVIVWRSFRARRSRIDHGHHHQEAHQQMWLVP